MARAHSVPLKSSSSKSKRRASSLSRTSKTTAMKRSNNTTPNRSSRSSSGSNSSSNHNRTGSSDTVTISRDEEVIMDLLTCGGKDLGSLVFHPTEEESNAVFHSTSPHQDLTPEVAARRVRQLLVPLEALIHAVEKRSCPPREALQHGLAILRAGLRQPIEERPQLLLSFPPASFSSCLPSFSSIGGRAQFLLHPTTSTENEKGKKSKKSARPMAKKRDVEKDDMDGEARKEEEEEGVRRYAMVQEAWAATSSPEGSLAAERLPPSLRPHNVVYHQLVSSRSVPLAGMVEGLYSIAYPSVKLRVELLCLLLRRELEQQGRALTEQVHDGRVASDASTTAVGAEKVAVEEQLAALLVTETLLTDFMAYYTNVIRYVGMSTAMHSQHLPESNGGEEIRNTSGGGGMAALALPPTVIYTSPSPSTPLSVPSSSSSSNPKVDAPPPPPPPPLPTSAAFPSTSAVKASLIRQYYELSDWILLVESTADIPPICLSQITRVQLQNGEEEGGRGAASAAHGGGGGRRHRVPPWSSQKTGLPPRHHSQHDEGVLRLEVRRPSTTTPWGLLFTPNGNLLDVDVAMRVGKHARYLHALLQRTDGGARIVSVNGHRLPSPPLSPSEERERTRQRSRRTTTASKRSLTRTPSLAKDDDPTGRGSSYAQRLAAYEQQVLQEVHRVTLSVRKMVLEVCSPAWTAAAMQECPRELLFYVPFQGGEGAAGQRACVVLHRRDAARISWSFSIEAQPPLPPSLSASTTTTPANGMAASSSSSSLLPRVLWHPSAPGTVGGVVWSDACRRFLQAFPQRLQLLSVNGVDIQTAGQAAALMGHAHTVILQLHVCRPPSYLSPLPGETTQGGGGPHHGKPGGEGRQGAGGGGGTPPGGPSRARRREDRQEGKEAIPPPRAWLPSPSSTAPLASTTSTVGVVALPSLGEVATAVAVGTAKKRRGTPLSTSSAVDGGEGDRSIVPPSAHQEGTLQNQTTKQKKAGADAHETGVDAKEANRKRLEGEGTEGTPRQTTGTAGKGRGRPTMVRPKEETEPKTTRTKDASTMVEEGEALEGEKATTMTTTTTSTNRKTRRGSETPRLSTSKGKKAKASGVDATQGDGGEGVSMKKTKKLLVEAETTTTTAAAPLTESQHSENEKRLPYSLPQPQGREEEGGPKGIARTDARRAVKKQSEAIQRAAEANENSAGKQMREKSTTARRTVEPKEEEEAKGDVPVVETTTTTTTTTTATMTSATADDTDTHSSFFSPCECVNEVRILSLDAKELVMERPSTDVPWGLPIKKRHSPSESSDSAIKGKPHKSNDRVLPLEVENLPPLRPTPLFSLSDSKAPLLPLSSTPPKSGKKGKNAVWKVPETTTASDSRRGLVSLGAGGESPSPSSSTAVPHPFLQRFQEQKNWPILAVNGVKVKDPSKAIQLMKSLTKMTLRFAR